MADSPNETVYLLDTSFFTFRAYHALPPLSTSEGVPTNAVQGVATMIERLLREEQARYVVACFDSAQATFRREMYPEYKANRDEPDEELRVQFPLVRRLVEAIGIKCLAEPGFEADDILATLAARYEREGRDVVIVTGDKDLMQCVTGKVSLFDAVKGKRVRAPQVIEKFGVPPEGVADVLGLMGDSSDNIPGVRGVGPKTAGALIAHFGSIGAMYEDTAAIASLGIRGAKSAQKKIEEGREAAELSHRLALVREDVPVEVSAEQLVLTGIAGPELDTFADELEMPRLPGRFRSLAKKIGIETGVDAADESHDAAAVASNVTSGGGGKAASDASGTARGTSSGRGAEITSPSAQGSLDFSAAAAPVSAAVEASRGKVSELAAGARLNLVLAATPSGDPVCALSAGGPSVVAVGQADVAASLAEAVARPEGLVGFDLKSLVRDYRLQLQGDCLDLGVASYLIDPSAGDHGPVDVCKRHLGAEAATAATDAELDRALAQVAELATILRAELDGRSQAELYREMELPLLSILGQCEARGILLDTEAMTQLSGELTGLMEELVGRIYEAAGQEFNILSPVQLRQILFEKLELPTKGIKKTKTGASTDSDSLAQLAPLHPLPDLVLEYRGYAKLKSTYVDALPRAADDGGRIHTRLNQTVAATGRLSSSDPNLQNIPVRTEMGARIRAAFIAPAGKRLVSADYNQIELRVLAHLSGDENLRGAFEDGVDIHTATSAELFEIDPGEVTATMRRDAKVVNYGIVYGMGPVRLSRELGIARKKAGEYIERYFERYPGVKEFYDEMLLYAREKGYVETLFGRRRYLPDINSDHGGRRQQAERVATNTPIQGSAADIIKRAMVMLDERLAASDLEGQLLLQIHDELLLECPAAEVDGIKTLLVETMEQAADLTVPILAEVGAGQNWGVAH